MLPVGGWTRHWPQGNRCLPTRPRPLTVLAPAWAQSTAAVDVLGRAVHLCPCGGAGGMGAALPGAARSKGSRLCPVPLRWLAVPDLYGDVRQPVRLDHAGRLPVDRRSQADLCE